MAGTVNNSTQNHSTVEKVESYEVGWLFVQQYYSVLNEDPSRLHCFYTKKSTQTIGGEGESVPLSHGQQEIHNRFVELDFRDCRVLVSNVDSQASLDGGIVIQVLGEIANKGGPSKKFCQTFFLAEQPNGYFVLNDIFRYLKDEVETDYEANPSLEESSEIVGTQPIVTLPEVPKAEPTQPEQPATQPIPTPEAQSTKPKVTEAAPAKQEVAEPKSATEPVKAENKASPSPSTAKPEVAATPSPAPVSSAPKSWANMAANNSDKWGSQAAAAQGVVAPAAKPQAPAPAPAPATSSQSNRNLTNKDNRNKSDDFVVYVRNVVDGITQEALQQAFSSFGSVKSIDIVHSKNSAFVEYEDTEHVKAAIAQSSITVNGHQLIAEKKRSRPPQGSSQTTGSGPRTGSQGGQYERNNSRRGGRGNARGGRPSGDRQPTK